MSLFKSYGDKVYYKGNYIFSTFSWVKLPDNIDERVDGESWHDMRVRTEKERQDNARLNCSIASKVANHLNETGFNPEA